MLQIDRRALVQSAGSLVLLTGLSHTGLWAAGLKDDPFTLGVASGDPWPDGFVLWTRLAPTPFDRGGGMPMVAVPVAWEVAEDARFTRIAQSGEAFARPELGHSVHVEVAGLKPARTYWYRFRAAGYQSAPGTVRTAPPAGAPADGLRIAVAGCQHWEGGFYTAYRHLAEEADLDAVFHYGDYIYEHWAQRVCPKVDDKPSCVREHIGDEIYSLDDYRRRYAQYKTDPDLQAAHRAAAFLSTFDDHEVDNNWVGDIDEWKTPPEVFRLRRFAAMQAWYEHMPVRAAQFPRFENMLAYRRLDYGSLLRVHLLDTRSYRSDQVCDDGKRKPCTPAAHDGATVLGAGQERWLDQGLGGGARWNLIAQQILTMPFDRRKPGETTPNLATDTWDGYRPARERLISSIRNHRLSNVVIASGDYHKHFAGTLPVREDALDGEMAAVEFLATSISTNGDGGPVKDLDTLLANNPHVALFADQRGYQLFDITAKRWQTDVKVVDRVSQQGGTLSTLARFAVFPDRAALHRD
ncbi:alkaline phosphatase D family protein [Sphingomonas sp. ACRSK]|uniref:alkaline phosphatase D family protein n=1 Tax=Sphingomonas sp. ACRSK TaxID=2918213 RepID=UPI001EF6B7B2|nr:alkaline phosphatase D family protein [Sphingomonas sp. ACRSK]MCG7349611.1 alkaline phosphatase D family protein [Sphingomonas sp. ACRSK]